MSLKLNICTPAVAFIGKQLIKSIRKKWSTDLVWKAIPTTTAKKLHNMSSQTSKRNDELLFKSRQSYFWVLWCCSATKVLSFSLAFSLARLISHKFFTLNFDRKWIGWEVHVRCLLWTHPHHTACTIYFLHWFSISIWWVHKFATKIMKLTTSPVCLATFTHSAIHI